MINFVLPKVESMTNGTVADSQITQMVKNVPVSLPRVRKGKTFNEEVSLPEQNRIMQALVEIVGKVQASKNEKYTYVDEDTIALAEQLPLSFDTTSKSFIEKSSESTTFTSFVTSKTDTETVFFPTEASSESIELTTVLETEQLLNIPTLAPNKNKETVAQLFTTTPSPVEEHTATMLPLDDNLPNLEKVTTESKTFSSVDLVANPTTTLKPFKELLNSYFEERLLINKMSTLSSDLSLAYVTTPMTAVEVTSDNNLITSEDNLPKVGEINTELESSTDALNEARNETSTVFTVMNTDSNLNIVPETSFATTTTSTNLHFNSPSIESTTMRSNVPESMIITNENTFIDEVTTEHPTKQFIRELIALKERQLKLNTVSSPIQTTTMRSIDEGRTSTSVEFNTRRTISSHGSPLFFFLTTSNPLPETKMATTLTPERLTTEQPLERENRKLPFAFYNTQGVSRAVDEGHFVSSFQDFYSDTNIFNGMMPAYVLQNDKVTNHVEMNSLWFGNKEQNR